MRNINYEIDQKSVLLDQIIDRILYNEINRMKIFVK